MWLMAYLNTSIHSLDLWVGYLGKILSRDEGQVEINVHFFKPPGEELTIRGFQLSAKDDVALVPLSNVIQIVESFKKKTRRARNYNVDEEELKLIERKYVSMMQNGDWIFTNNNYV